MKIKGILGMELCRFLRSWQFIATVFGIALLCVIGSYSSMNINNSGVNVFSVLLDLNQFNILIILMAAIPFGMCFCQEWNSGYIRFIIGRKGTMKYTASLYLVGCLSAYITVMLGLFLYVLILSFRIPLHIDDLDLSYVLINGIYGELLEDGLVWNYFLCRIHLIAMEAVLCVGLGITVSAILPDSFTAVTVPFVLKYMLDIITDGLPTALNFDKIAKAYQIWNSGVLINLLYVCVLFSACLLLGYLVFQRWVYRRLENELC